MSTDLKVHSSGAVKYTYCARKKDILLLIAHGTFDTNMTDRNSDRKHWESRTGREDDKLNGRVQFGASGRWTSPKKEWTKQLASKEEGNKGPNFKQNEKAIKRGSRRACYLTSPRRFRSSNNAQICLVFINCGYLPSTAAAFKDVK